MNPNRLSYLFRLPVMLVIPAMVWLTGACTGPGMTARTEYDDSYFNRSDLEIARQEAIERSNNPDAQAGDTHEDNYEGKRRKRDRKRNQVNLATGPSLFISPWYVSPGLGWSRTWGPAWYDPYGYGNLGWSPRPWAWSNWYATPYMGWNNTWGWYSGWQGGAYAFGDPWSMGWGSGPGWNSWGWNTGGWNGWGWNQGGWNSWNNPMNPWYSPFYCWTSPRQTNPQTWGGNSTAAESRRTRMAMSPGNTSSSYQRPGSARNVRPQGGRSSSSSGWSGSGSGTSSGSTSSSLWRSSSSGSRSSSGSSSFFSQGSSSWGGGGSRSSSFSGGTRGGGYGGGSSGASGGRSGSGGPRGGRSR